MRRERKVGRNGETEEVDNEGNQIHFTCRHRRRDEISREIDKEGINYTSPTDMEEGMT